MANVDGDYTEVVTVTVNNFECGFRLPTVLVARLVECGIVSEGLDHPAGEHGPYYPTRPEYHSPLMVLLGALDLPQLRLNAHLEIRRGGPA